MGTSGQNTTHCAPLCHHCVHTVARFDRHGKNEPDRTISAQAAQRAKSRLDLPRDREDPGVKAAAEREAADHRAWWSNNPDNNVMTKVLWLEADSRARGGHRWDARLGVRRIDTPLNSYGFAESAPKEAYATKRREASRRRGTEGHDPHRAGVCGFLTEPALPEWADCWTRNTAQEAVKPQR